MNFLLALTVGLLAFMLIDMTSEALELAASAAALFQGSAMVWLAGLASFLLLMAIGWGVRRRIGGAWHLPRPRICTAQCDGSDWYCWTLLHKSADGRTAPYPGQTYPATFVTGMPSAV